VYWAAMCHGTIQQVSVVVGVRTVDLPGAGVAVTSAVKAWLDRNPVLGRQTAARVMADTVSSWPGCRGHTDADEPGHIVGIGWPCAGAGPGR